TPMHISELFSLMDKGEISIKMAKEIFPEIFRTGKMPSQVLEERGMKQISDEKFIEQIVRKAMTQNPKAVEQYKSGKTNIIGYFIGQVMKETKGSANPQLVNEIVKRLLEGST
ncbi:MAG TPA: Asp-tRNA(Asn)/Glu-tRNA(Gln) amidotransferase GatCAB subunit B, partial [Pseudothermotoga sp.]